MRKVQDDDELMFKMIMFYLVAKYTRKVEQWGESRAGCPGLQAGRRTVEDSKGRLWRAVRQANWSQREERDLCWKGGGGPGDDTKQLARWAPGLCREIARALMEPMGEEIKLQKMSWKEHVALGYTPFRRDCRICQEAAKDRPHPRVPHSLAGCLSIDITTSMRLPQSARRKEIYAHWSFYLGKEEEAVRLEEGGEDEIFFQARGTKLNYQNQINHCGGCERG